MKKFTSLFALLSCLSVYNAQAEDVTISVYASNPENQHIYWYEGQAYPSPDSNDLWNSWGTFSESPLIKNMGTFDGIFYKIKLKLGTDHIKLKFFTDAGGGQNETEAITVTTASDKYFYYSGGANYSHENSFNFYLSGSFNNWGKDAFTSEGNGKWTKTLEISEQVQFKIRPGDGWLGYNTMFSQGNPYGFVYRWNGGDHDDNIILDPIPTISKINLTVTWIPNASPSLTIEGAEMNLNDNKEFITQLNLANFNVVEATYTRPSSGDNNHWGTLCLPFEIKNSYDGVTFYQLSEVTETSMKFSPIGGTIGEGTPIAFKLTTPGTLTISESNVAVVADPTTSTIPNWSMKGTFQLKTLSGIYYVYNDFYRRGNNITVKPYRGWFETTTTNAPSFSIEIEEEQSLDFVEQEDGTVVVTYDLQGRKLDKARKGLVIENGKIIMIK